MKFKFLSLLLLLTGLCVPSGAAEAADTEPATVVKIDEALARSVVDRIALDVARIRGLEFERSVPVSVVSDDQAMAQHLRRMEEHGELDDLRLAETVMKVLGLADPDADVIQLIIDALREQVGGYYDPATGEFYLLDDMPAAMVEVLTAHELTHALEDQHYQLDALLDSEGVNDDEIFARGSITEGSATLLMTLFTVEQAIQQELGEEAVEALSSVSVEAMERMPEALVREMLAPYILGMAFVQGGNAMSWMADGFPVDRVNALYDAPPLSSEQILHPEKYWDAEKRDDPIAVELGRSGEQLGRGWIRETDGVLGEMNVAVLVGASTPDSDDPRAMYGSAWTNRAASGWGGDRYELWSRGKRSVVLLSTVWDTEQDAEQFVAAMAKNSDGITRMNGQFVAIVFGDAPRKKLGRIFDSMLRAATLP